MNSKSCSEDCPGKCADRECTYLRELPDGRIVAVTCAGVCGGKCVGAAPTGNRDARIEGDGLIAPTGRSRVPIRSKEIGWELLEGLPGGEQYERSCAVGCFVGHAAGDSRATTNCFGSCVGICFGLARVVNVWAPAVPAE